MPFPNFCKFHEVPIKINDISSEKQFWDGHYHTTMPYLKPYTKATGIKPIPNVNSVKPARYCILIYLYDFKGQLQERKILP